MGFFEQVLYILKDGIELGLIWALLALGVFISFRILDFADLTAEGTITLGSSIMAVLLIKTDSILLGMLIAFSGGFISGIITGVLHTKFKIPPILSGIIMMTALYSLNRRILGKASVYLAENKTIYTFLRTIIDSPFFAKALTSFSLLLIIVIMIYLLFGTEIGISIRATGMNQKMAKVQGINTDLMIIFGLALSNALIALCGALVAQSNRSANLEVGRGTIVIGLASIIIGEILFGKRTFKNCLISVVLGSIVFQLLIGIAITIGLNPNDLKLIQAVLIAFILAAPEVKKWRKKNGGKQNVKVEQYI
ncbi:MAG: ABC transporter permease [Acholeplasmataceae bacterium]|jgi:putative ABC transport system permease protein|nr:ABC transporter permease [Acholeplasmataceae bacterium]